MEKVLTEVLDKYRIKSMTNRELAKLIIAHIKVGVNGKKGWFLDLSTHDGQNKRAEEMIKEFGG